MSHIFSSSGESSWTPEEWRKVQSELEGLSVEQLKLIATRCGIKFEDGIESLENNRNFTVKEQLLLVMDEINPSELKRELKVTRKSKGVA